MTRQHEVKRGRAAEPVQVYLNPNDRGTLDQLAQHLVLSKSDVVRRAIAALERETFAPESHPALRLLGMVQKASGARLSYDPAIEHDRYLAEVADATSPKPKRKRRGK